MPRTARRRCRKQQLPDRRTSRASVRCDVNSASEASRLAMIPRMLSRKGTRRRSAISALRIFADEIIFMAPVIFSVDATEPMRPLSSLSVAILAVFRN